MQSAAWTSSGQRAVARARSATSHATARTPCRRSRPSASQSRPWPVWRSRSPFAARRTQELHRRCTRWIRSWSYATRRHQWQAGRRCSGHTKCATIRGRGSPPVSSSSGHKERSRYVMADTSFQNEGAVEGGMRRRTLLGAGAASAALALAMGRLGHAHAAPQEAPTPGWGSSVKIRFFAGGNAGDAFASIVFNGAQQAQSHIGANVDYVFSGWDVNKMTDQLREAIAAQPDGIAMMGHPGDDALMPLAQQAH